MMSSYSFMPYTFYRRLPLFIDPIYMAFPVFSCTY